MRSDAPFPIPPHPPHPSTRPHPRRKVPGVGKVAQRVLAAFGVHTGADLLAQRRLLGLEVRLMA